MLAHEETGHRLWPDFVQINWNFANEETGHALSPGLTKLINKFKILWKKIGDLDHGVRIQLWKKTIFHLFCNLLYYNIKAGSVNVT